ncbi:hypothetical protein D0T84_16355 [Dysgonomonas sp. 521]|uniref:hypothetical protein n=1 Tax=Dysgonomonas sp. 521 TaxID=2302932 RepID=UPI0013D6ECEF|nr:hypothetical protein [Dysgonomonas sp. 521]NDV96474.1 hypothetical protein [Dysgonomonas sp. 521]
MKAKVTWRNKNPFCPRWEDLGRVSEAEIADDMEIETIIRYAKEATPDGFWLHTIETPYHTVTYNYNGDLVNG